MKRLIEGIPHNFLQIKEKKIKKLKVKKLDLSNEIEKKLFS